MIVNGKNQNGAVLLVALVMLLILTIIGLASMRGTTLQEKMAGNFKDREISFQAAEASLRKGEQRVLNKFLEGSLDTLELTDIKGSYENFPDVGQDPTYHVTLIAKIRTTTEIGVPVGDEGAITKVESKGYGLSSKTITELNSTYLVEH